FGFRRLSILDLSEHGHQPMSLPEHDLHIVFNGEIYNWRALRAELSGYSFVSHTDTETILYAYLKWGRDCVQHFIGMWAFALWDGRQNQLFCSRDRYGIKPFYYHLQDGIFAFGSELKQLVPHTDDRALNYPMILRSMKINSMMVYGEETYWLGLKALLPGENLLVSSGGITRKRYYQLDVASFESSKLSFAEATSRYRELFLDSLNLQMQADVDIGSCLSGGMDSSAIVCAANSLFGRKFSTFSAYFGIEPALDERRWIQEVISHTGVPNHQVSPDAKAAWEWFAELTYMNDLPLGAGYAAQYSVMKLAREKGIKVLLDGQGSDEISAGYTHGSYRYYADLVHSFQLGSAIRGIVTAGSDKKLKHLLQSTLKTLLACVLSESALYRLELSYYRFNPFNREFMAKARAGTRDILAEIEDLPCSKLSNFLYNLMHNTSIGTLLHNEDRMSMANSVESRVPFLDHRLVDFSFSLPSAYKSKAPYNKYLHRMAMKELVPEAIFTRRDKAIFSSPFHRHWLKEELKAFVKEVLHSQQFRHRGIWNLALIHEKWDSYLKGNLRHAEMIFNVIALEFWFREWENI
ncbi:MAG: asparagine synthase (glutamine-hydrolyzing), partial [Candidatus Cloacimonetes bacterium]|nr:asparagine synthase (glutamine-hydrolyzing) [Candidatus Cloacimonadota bacterium]